VLARRALRERKPPPTLCDFFLVYSQGGSTIFGFALSGNGREFFSPILDPDADLDHHQNLLSSKVG